MCIVLLLILQSVFLILENSYHYTMRTMNSYTSGEGVMNSVFPYIWRMCGIAHVKTHMEMERVTSWKRRQRQTGYPQLKM